MIGTADLPSRRASPAGDDRGRVPSRRAYLVATLVLGVFCEGTHVLVGQFTLGRPWHEVTLPIDAALPVVPGFVWVYQLWAPFLFLPAAVAKDAHRLHRGLLAALGACLSAYVVFLLFPVHVLKPVLGTGMSERALAAVYAADTVHGGAYLPSLHVATAWIAACATLRQGLSRWAEALAVAFAAAIIVSTVLTKQHVAADIVAGLAWGMLWWHVARRAYPRLSGGEPDLRAAWRGLVRRVVPIAVEAVVVCILLPAVAWWVAGHLAPAADAAGGAQTPGKLEAWLPLLLLGVAAIVAWKRGAPRLARDAGLVLVFAAVAILEGDPVRAAVGGSLLFLLLLAVRAVPFGAPAVTLVP